MLRRAIVVGASSGIGEALARQLDSNGYTLGLMGRRENLLGEIAKDLGNYVSIKRCDLLEPEGAAVALEQLIQEMGGIDLCIFSAGVGFDNPDLQWEPERKTIATNVAGFTCCIDSVARYFESRGSGHMVAISSIAAVRGHGDAPAYGASKAYMSSYLRSLRTRFRSKNHAIAVTEVRPGFVATTMAKSSKLFWVASPEVVAKQIIEAIREKRELVYVTRRWRFVALLLKLFPWVLSDRV